MTPNPTRDTPAGRAYNDLRNLAKAQRRDPAEYLALYALERFLARLADSDVDGDFVLKGGVLLAAFAARRPTRDIDLAASGFANDITDVEDRLRAIFDVSLEDGLQFDMRTVRSEPIREDNDYSGVRVHVVAAVAKARIPVHVDVNFGDPIWPAPQLTTVPLLLGGEIRLLGYPVHMVLAEKIVTAVDRGAANTRWRDFVDIASITRTQPVAGADLATAIGIVADHRGVELRSMAQTLDGMAAIAQTRWTVWRRKQNLADGTPERFQDLLDEVVAFADPVLGRLSGQLTWRPAERAWCP